MNQTNAQGRLTIFQVRYVCKIKKRKEKLTPLSIEMSKTRDQEEPDNYKT